MSLSAERRQKPQKPDEYPSCAGGGDSSVGAKKVGGRSQLNEKAGKENRMEGDAIMFQEEGGGGAVV